MDPLRYHRFAWYLARRYGYTGGPHSPEDVYQIAMVALLELWRTEPEADEKRCRRRMKSTVQMEIRKQHTQKRAGELVPIEAEQDRLKAPDNVEREVMGEDTDERVGQAMASLPDAEFQMLGLLVMGHRPQVAALQAGWTMEQATKALAQGKAMMRARLARMGITA